jgi:sigma-B regulation protein RsbU (phosphoserine phosphatase)
MTATRLQRLEAMVKEMSVVDDPERLIHVFSRQTDLTVDHDALLTLTRRDLTAPWYRITRYSRWRESINPWTETQRLPLFDRGFLGELLYAGKPTILNHFETSADDPGIEYLNGMQSLICAPSFDHGQPVNMVILFRREPNSFLADDLESFLLNANLVGRTVGNLILMQQLQEAKRALDYEQEQIGRMQRHLLPAELPRIEGLELDASYFACRRAGGDYYDVLPLPEDQWGLFVADVSGHGTPAAVVMAMMHTLLHSFPGPVMPPAHVFAHLNRHLLSMAPEGMFATAFYGVYDPYYRRLRHASAGHPAPLLRRGTDQVEEIAGTTGVPLGVAEEDNWTEREVSLAPGDALLLYTDGIVEGCNSTGESFGRERLETALRQGPRRAGRLVLHLERHYKDFCNGAADIDDRTLLAAVAVP